MESNHIRAERSSRWAVVSINVPIIVKGSWLKKNNRLLDESGSETPLSGLYERLRTNTPSNMSM